MKKNSDIKEAIGAGDIRSAAEHFISHGFFENRPPSDVTIDEADYFEKYPDVMEAVNKGDIESATEHWLRFGRFEGRNALLLVS